MIKEVLLKKYETSDGAQYDTLEAAERQQALLNLEKELEHAPELYWGGMPASDVAEWLLDRYTLTKKDTK